MKKELDPVAVNAAVSLGSSANETLTDAIKIAAIKNNFFIINSDRYNSLRPESGLTIPPPYVLSSTLFSVVKEKVVDVFVLSILVSLADVKDAESLRFLYSSEQGYDTSCGLSSVACLMEAYWGIDVSEEDLVLQLFEGKGTTGEYSVSLADVGRMLKARGFVTAAYKMNYEQFAAAVEKYTPIIVHYGKPNGHFALALAVDDEGVIAADPAEGTVLVGKTAFLERWSGNVMLAALPSAAVNQSALTQAIETVRGRARFLDRLAISSHGRW